jgi:putative transposase
VTADRFYPSSKTCSGCGLIKNTLSLSERVFHCEACGLSLDRDENAAINLRKLVLAERPEVSGKSRLSERKALAGRHAVECNQPR